VPAIAISSRPVENAPRISPSNRRRASVFRRAARHYVGRDSHARPRLLSSSVSAAVARAARCRCSVSGEPGASVAGAKEWRGGASTLSRSVCQCALYLHFDAARNKSAPRNVIATLAGIAETAAAAGQQVRRGRPTVLGLSIAVDAWRVARRSKERAVDGQNERSERAASSS